MRGVDHLWPSQNPSMTSMVGKANNRVSPTICLSFTPHALQLSENPVLGREHRGRITLDHFLDKLIFPWVLTVLRPHLFSKLPSLSLHWKDKFSDFPSLGWTMLSQKWLMHWHDPTSCHFLSSPLSPFLHLTCCPHLRSTCFPLLYYPITQREVFLKTLDPSTFVLLLLSPPSATTSVEHTVTSPSLPFHTSYGPVLSLLSAHDSDLPVSQTYYVPSQKDHDLLPTQSSPIISRQACSPWYFVCK